MEIGDFVDEGLDTFTRAATPENEVTVVCRHGERAITTTGLLTARKDPSRSRFDGGPDTTADAIGRGLEIES